MADPRLAQAIDRIESALRRIEAAASASSDGAGGSGAAAAEFSHLAARHDALRDEVRGALRAIDALTATQGTG